MAVRPLHVVPAARRAVPARHVGALAAAALYAAALGVGFGLVTAARDRHADVAGISAEVGREAPIGARATGPEILTMRTLAARAQQSVFTIEGSGGSTGSGLVAWVADGRSYLLTARAVVDGVLADGFETVFVRRGRRFWTAAIVGVDRANALALLRVDTRIGDPLWQARRGEPLSEGDAAVIVPAGPNAAFGEGFVAPADHGRFVLRAGVDETLGAAAVAENGRLAGIVVAVRAGGVNRIVPIQAACERLRRCP